MLPFTITNLGNVPELFLLIPNLSPDAPVVDQFNPLAGSAGQLFADVNSNGQLAKYTTLLTQGIAHYGRFLQESYARAQ